jgi:hypothetical protein
VRCLAEMCGNWTGDGCACRVFDMEPQDVSRWVDGDQMFLDADAQAGGSSQAAAARRVSSVAEPNAAALLAHSLLRSAMDDIDREKGHVSASTWGTLLAVAEALEPTEGDATARVMLAQYAEQHGAEPRLGCDLVAHRDLGLCGACYTASGELTAWRLLAMAERSIPRQSWESTQGEPDA